MPFPIIPTGVLKKKAGGIPTDGLIAEWLFSNNLNDTSSNGYNFDNSNNVSYVDDRKSSANSAVYFNGTDAYAYVGTFADIITSDWSLSFWLRADSDIPNNKTFIAYGDASQTSKYFSFRRYNSNLYYGGSWDSGLSIPTVTWTHFVITYDYSELDLYVYKNNGSPASKLNLALGNSATTEFMIGAFITPTTGLWKGAIDDFRVYNRILTPVEIAALYNE